MRLADAQPHISLLGAADTRARTDNVTGAADARHEGAQLGQEAVRWVQEREEEEGALCVYHLLQEPEA